MAFKFCFLMGNKELHINVHLKNPNMLSINFIFSILVVNNEENSKPTFIIFFFFAQRKSAGLVKSGNEGNPKNYKKITK